LTLGFDATTQGGRRFNAILVTSQEQTVVLAIDELAGGTAEDYSGHVLSTLERLAKNFSQLTGADEETTLQHFVLAIVNTMSDRCTTNHAAIEILRKRWGKSIQELFCHVHPLDSFASKVRAAVKLEESR
jgi:exonuclease V gamma subunit